VAAMLRARDQHVPDELFVPAEPEAA
jgi:hypothetical protein